MPSHIFCSELTSHMWKILVWSRDVWISKMWKFSRLETCLPQAYLSLSTRVWEHLFKRQTPIKRPPWHTNISKPKEPVSWSPVTKKVTNDDFYHLFSASFSSPNVKRDKMFQFSLLLFHCASFYLIIQPLNA